MDLLLILTYAAFAYGVFRIFKIPVNGFTMLTAVLGGAALIGALLWGMNYNHPYTSEARFYFNTTPIIPAVSGVVTEVPVQGNTMLKAGDVLFRIDPAPFENAVKAKEAALAAAVQTTHQLRATADAAQKKLESALADRDGARDVFERSKKLLETGAIAQVQFERAKNTFNADEATAQSAKSEGRPRAARGGSSRPGSQYRRRPSAGRTRYREVQPRTVRRASADRRHSPAEFFASRHVCGFHAAPAGDG